MRKEDFDEMKAFCNEKGFELLNVDHEDNEKFYVIAVKKDLWKGVEFAEIVAPTNDFITNGKIYRIESMETGHFLIRNDDGISGGMVFKGLAQPSTESAYIEQLKKEAHERFGEINPGDTFMDEPDGFIRSCNKGMVDNWHYSKEKDALFAFGARIYQQGKWATRVRERVEVEPISGQFFQIDNTVQFKFKTINMNGLKGNITEFLASQLEKYLNNEIK